MSSLLDFQSLLTCRTVSGVELSADGKRVAFIVSGRTHPKDEPLSQELWTGLLGTGELHRIAGSPDAHGSPAWVHVDNRLAFTCDRGHPGRLTPWLWEAGKTRPIGRVGGYIEAILWSADDSSLLVLEADPDCDGGVLSNCMRHGGMSESDPQVLRPRSAWRRLLLIDVDTGDTRDVTPEGLNVWEVGWNGMGEAVAIVSSDPSESAAYDAHVALLDLDQRTHRVVHESRWQLQCPAIAPNRQHIAFVEGWSSDRSPVAIGTATVLDLASGEVHALGQNRHVQRLRWCKDGSLFYVGQAGIGTMCGRLTLDGEVLPIWQGAATLGQTHVHSAAISDDGRVIAAAKEAPAEPPELMILDATDPAAKWQELTELNAELRTLRSPCTERCTWESEGVEIEGILLTPAGGEDRPLPLIVIVHGGPANAWTMNFSPGYMDLGAPLANRGYAVLLPNTRGSTGRGDTFLHANLGLHGPLELTDILAGIDALDKAGIVDRERAGITGVSAGGYTSAYAATTCHAFRAAVPMSCVSDWLSFHLTSDIGRFDEIVLQSDPYDPAGNHIPLSPVMHAQGADTPTLILHGALDLCTPVGQAQELYQALADARVETELVIYQRAGHGWTQREYLLDTWERVSAWFDRFLLGDGSEPSGVVTGATARPAVG